MKSKKTLMTLGVIVAVLVLGIGYAAITKLNLNITGNAAATAAQDNFKVKFETTTVSDEDKVTATVTGDLAATITVKGLTKAGDSVTATYTITNESEGLSAKVSQGDITGNTDYFTVKTDWEETTLTSSSTGASKIVTVTVTLKKTPITDQSTTITIPFTAEPVEE